MRCLARRYSQLQKVDFDSELSFLPSCHSERGRNVASTPSRPESEAYGVAGLTGAVAEGCGYPSLKAMVPQNITQSIRFCCSIGNTILGPAHYIGLLRMLSAKIEENLYMHTQVDKSAHITNMHAKT